MATEKQPRFGVAFLAYNEEELIEKTVRDAAAALSQIPGLDWRILIVDDGSKDRTGEISDRLAKEDARILVAHHQGNKGYAVATETALRSTPGEVVMVVDGDGQHTLADAPKFLGATYVRPKTQAPSPDGRQYGGFIVRVYFDGQLQDVRAAPPELLTLFPAPDQLAPPPNAAPSPSN